MLIMNFHSTDLEESIQHDFHINRKIKVAINIMINCFKLTSIDDQFIVQYFISTQNTAYI